MPGRIDVSKVQETFGSSGIGTEPDPIFLKQLLNRQLTIIESRLGQCSSWWPGSRV